MGSNVSRHAVPVESPKPDELIKLIGVGVLGVVVLGILYYIDIMEVSCPILSGTELFCG